DAVVADQFHESPPAPVGTTSAASQTSSSITAGNQTLCTEIQPHDTRPGRLGHSSVLLLRHFHSDALRARKKKKCEKTSKYFPFSSNNFHRKVYIVQNNSQKMIASV